MVYLQFGVGTFYSPPLDPSSEGRVCFRVRVLPLVHLRGVDLEVPVHPPCPFWMDLGEAWYFLLHALYRLPRSRLTTRWEAVVHRVFLVSPEI